MEKARERDRNVMNGSFSILSPALLKAQAIGIIIGQVTINGKINNFRDTI